jgi:hypothetical protein
LPNFAYFALDLETARFDEFRRRGASLVQDFGFQLQCLQAQPIPLLRRNAFYVFQFGLITDKEILSLFLHLAGIRACPFSSSLALLEEPQQRFE